MRVHPGDADPLARLVARELARLGARDCAAAPPVEVRIEAVALDASLGMEFAAAAIAAAVWRAMERN
jgi:hypothetical protein